MKVKENVSNLVTRVRMMMLMAVAGLPVMSASNCLGYASASEPMDIIVQIADVLVKLFPPVGVIFVLFGGFKVVMAVRNDQPEAIKTAVMDIVVGVVLIIFDAFLWDGLKGAIGV